MTDNQESEIWREHDAEMKDMRHKRRGRWHQAMDSLISKGIPVRKITPYQYRIEDWLDIYPSNKRYHIISSGARGRIEVPFEQFVMQMLKK